mgnify:FL=1
MRVINIKKDMPNSEYAIFLMEKEIDILRAMGENILIVVHGYGSSGEGGLIKREVKRDLERLKHFNKILDYVEGEKCGETNEVYKAICLKFPELVINKDLGNLNSGVTLVWIQ